MMIKIGKQPFHKRLEVAPFTAAKCKIGKQPVEDARQYIVNHRGSEPRVNGGYMVRDVESGVKFIAVDNNGIYALAHYLMRRSRKPLDEIDRPDISAFIVKGYWLRCRTDGWCFYVNDMGRDLMISDNFDDRLNDRRVSFSTISNDTLYQKADRRFHGLRGWNHIIVKI